ncbi:polysaccharide deacetylase family protein [Bacillus luteolus]|uniref:Polysaccharide deacetylase family protein n=1 Tax=Litchfieldia luteola TaxID=682179 RepID=A0ABR9QF99_9BACI|nr:polysaccharide deacetylase family protein [Cytobacillus luteolus]MBE4907167.1 polysaccharide deacetylase family protein [Cytobacillus luteolus]MBP1943363.1 peptidoglycan/xylan/chitin deacetylase (PgdA/CDA1 family)/SH3-like domain-containing protein [Cytobacillus luteolus]
MARKLLSLSFLLLFVTSYPQQNSLAMHDFIQYLLYENEIVHVQAVTDIQTKSTTVNPNEPSKSDFDRWLYAENNQVAGWISSTNETVTDIKGKFFTSSTPKMQIRRGAHDTYKQVGFLERGHIVNAIDRFENSVGETWIQINNGKVTGWVPLDSMEVFNGDTNYLNKAVFIKVDAQLRREATYDARTVHIIDKEKQVVIKSSIIINNETWYRLQVEDKSGWVHHSDITNELTLAQDFNVGQEATHIRKGADASYDIVSKLPIGQKVQATTMFINGKNEIWYRLELENGKTGWILGIALTPYNVKKKAKAISTIEKEKVAYLTIDDGPTSYTGKLLDILKEYNAKATFFMLDGPMKTYDSDVKRMVAEGHALGSHGVTHDKNIFYHSPASAVSELQITRETIKRIAGLKSNLMRVPYGSVPYMKKNYRHAAANEQFIMWDWNVDSLDWKFNSSRYVDFTLEQVRRVEGAGQSPIILIHDRKATIDNLPKLLEALDQLGYSLAPLTEDMQPYQFKTK